MHDELIVEALKRVEKPPRYSRRRWSRRRICRLLVRRHIGRTWYDVRLPDRQMADGSEPDEDFIRMHRHYLPQPDGAVLMRREPTSGVGNIIIDSAGLAAFGQPASPNAVANRGAGAVLQI